MKIFWHGAAGIVLSGLMAFGTAFGQTHFQELTSSGTGDVPPSSSMSLDDAYSYVVKVFNARVKEQNAELEKRKQMGMNFPAPSINGAQNPNQIAFQEMGKKLVPIGFTNLDLILKQFKEEQKRGRIGFETFNDLKNLMNIALKASITDADLPSILEKSADDPDYIGYVVEHPEWWHRQEVIQLVKNQMAQTSNGGGSAATALIGLNDSQSSSRKSSSNALDDFSQSSVRRNIFTIATLSLDPAYKDIIAQEVQSVVQNHDIGIFEFDMVFEYCVKDASGAYTAILPALFANANTMTQQMQKGHQAMPHNYTMDLFDFLSKNPKFCVDTQMQQTAHDMLDLDDKAQAAQGYSDPKSPDHEIQQDALAALLGDADALKKMCQHYIANAAQYQDGSSRASYDLDVMNSITYIGAGERIPGIINNLSTAAYDTTKGQWVVTAPAAYTGNSSAPIGSDLIKQKIADMIQSKDADDKDGKAIVEQLRYFILPSKPTPDCVALFPDLLKLFQDNRADWERKGGYLPFSQEDLFQILSENPSLCANSQLHDTAVDLLAQNKRQLHDSNSKSVDSADTVLDAFFGDEAALGQILKHYQDVEIHGGARNGWDDFLISSVVYKGPGGKRGMLDNQSSAKFDSNTGQWTVTAPTDYTGPAKDR